MCAVEVSRTGRAPVSEVGRVPQITHPFRGGAAKGGIGCIPGGGGGIDPHKIGVLGFSAGGHLVAAVSTHFKQRLYGAADAADKESCRPDFGVALYPGHMLENTSNEFELNPYVPVTSQTPPMFLLEAEDDPIDTEKNSLVYYAALKKAGVPVEMHLYVHGEHGFGLRRAKSPITEWPQLVERWLETIGITSE